MPPRVAVTMDLPTVQPMAQSKPGIPWWIYLALAVACFLAIDAAHQVVRQWVDSRPSAEVVFAHNFVANFLGVLKVALPLFALILAGLAAFGRARPSRVETPLPAEQGEAPPVEHGQAAASKPSRTTRFPLPSEVEEISYGLLRRMEWRRFEILCAEYLRCLNYEVLETGFGAKDAVDLEVFLPGKGELMSVVKCVAGDGPVTLAMVRDFLGTLRARQVGEGMVFSVCGFTRSAERFASRHRIGLVSGEVLCSRVRSLGGEVRAALTQVAVAGDYSTPTCPACGVKLVLRRRGHARPGRREFWGCMNHPRCRFTLPLR